MCERADYRITCTASTDISVSTAYADADELFYGHTCNDGELGMLLSVDGDEVVNSDNEGDLQRIRVVATGDEDTPEVIVTGLSDEKKLVHSELTRGCGCPEDCYSQFTEDEVYSIRLQMLELQKTEKEMLLLGKLQVCATPPDVVHHARKATKAKRRRITYQYAFDGRYVCKPAFCFLHCTGEKALKNLQHQREWDNPSNTWKLWTTTAQCFQLQHSPKNSLLYFQLCSCSWVASTSSPKWACRDCSNLPSYNRRVQYCAPEICPGMCRQWATGCKIPCISCTLVAVCPSY